MAKQAKVVKKRKVKVEAIGEAHIQASFNNIIISLTNKNGEVISWASAGKMGFRGSKKNTPFAAQVAAENCSQVAYEAGLRRVKVFVKGPGAGRESAMCMLLCSACRFSLSSFSYGVVFEIVSQSNTHQITSYTFVFCSSKAVLKILATELYFACFGITVIPGIRSTAFISEK